MTWKDVLNHLENIAIQKNLFSEGSKQLNLNRYFKQTLTKKLILQLSLTLNISVLNSLIPLYFCSLFLRAQGRFLPSPTPPSTYSLLAWNKWKLISLVRNLKIYRKMKKWKYQPPSLLLPTSCTSERCSNTGAGADTCGSAVPVLSMHDSACILHQQPVNI